MRPLVLVLCIAALALPTAASARPIDDGPLPPHKAAPTTPRPEVRANEDTWVVILAGVALLVAMTSAAYTAVRLAPAR